MELKQTDLTQAILAHTDLPMGQAIAIEQLKCTVKQCVDIFENLLDSMGLGENNFPISTWQMYQELKEASKG
jgi:hypothetical protein